MTSNPPDWNSFIYPTDDGITGSGTITWWVEAVDSIGLTASSDKQQITVVRCDVEASITSFLRDPVEGSLQFNCQSAPKVSFGITASDADEPTTGNLQVVLNWTLTHVGVASLSGSATATSTGGSSWSVTLSTSVVNNWDRQEFLGDDQVGWTVTSTDQYGGKSSRSFTAPITISECSSGGLAPPEA
jgi:hypothetical protein